MVMPGQESNETTPEVPLVLSASVGNDGATTKKTLRLMFLGCEDKPPYGPTEHTGKLFLELTSQALAETSPPETAWSLSIAIFPVQQGQYPTDWDAYDGIIIGGSMSDAYGTDPWIEKLKDVIQKEIVKKSRPTLGICFGHQVLPHSFSDGKAAKHCEGTRAGRHAMATTKAGEVLLGNPSVELFYSHGDMVEKLPSCAVALGEEGNNLPIQSAAYFRNDEEARSFSSGMGSSVRPFAVTFQAHPEYAVSHELGLSGTLNKVLETLQGKELISKEYGEAAREDAKQQFDLVHRASKDAFIASARALGWFS